MTDEATRMVEAARAGGYCPRCKGDGTISEAGYSSDCPHCDGTGDFPEPEEGN